MTGTPATTTSILKDTTATSTATCPAGTVLLSGGSRWVALDAVGVPADHRRIGVTDSYPSSASTWTVTIRNTENATSLATVTAYAICAG